MLKQLTIEEQLELIRIAKERIDEVVALVKNARKSVIEIENTNKDDARILQIHFMLDEALVALQGPKDKDTLT